jgi:hypothetical protein
MIANIEGFSPCLQPISQFLPFSAACLSHTVRRLRKIAKEEKGVLAGLKILRENYLFEPFPSTQGHQSRRDERRSELSQLDFANAPRYCFFVQWAKNRTPAVKESA